MPGGANIARCLLPLICIKYQSSAYSTRKQLDVCVVSLRKRNSMHFLNKPLYRIAIILVLLWLSTALAPATGQAQSTLPHVSGLITSDTQWTAAGGPYVLDGDV